MPDPLPGSDFVQVYEASCKAVFRAIAAEELAGGVDAAERAHDFAARGKPEFALAYLLTSDLPNAERFELYAHAFDRRADLTEAKARELDRTFHRSFALLFAEARKDRAMAQAIRATEASDAAPGESTTLPTADARLEPGRAE